MPTATRICKVCGKVYPYCKTERPKDMFRWQDVACSPECGAEYFRLIAISRGELKEEPKKEPKEIVESFMEDASEPVVEVAVDEVETAVEKTTKSLRQRRKKNQ